MNIVRGRILLHNISVRTIFSESMYKLMFNNETRRTKYTDMRGNIHF